MSETTEYMQIHIFETDYEVICVRAALFPIGVRGAHKKLGRLLPEYHRREIFGISYGLGSSDIAYWAAASRLSADEVLPSGTEVFVIKKGRYAMASVENFMANHLKVGHTFRHLLTHPELDLDGYCLEVYDGPDVRCMVKLT